MRSVLPTLALACLAGCTSGTPCPGPLEPCGDVCYDLRSDPSHCGTCGNACTGGLACVDGKCATDPGQAECPSRTGGAFVTLLDGCGDVVKLWSTSPAFIARAETLAADPTAAGASVPRFDLYAGADCDDQWSWHVDPLTATFLAAPDSALCNACASQVQSAISYYLADVRTWCPTPSEIVAVHRQ